MATATRTETDRPAAPESGAATGNAPEPLAVPGPMAEPPRRFRFTVEHYYRLAELGFLDEDSRVELIEGDIVEMCPIGPHHSSSVTRLATRFHRVVGDRAIIRVQDPIRLDELSEPEPDVVLTRYREDYYASGHPGPADVLLLVEVMDSSASYDRGTKLKLYARFGVAEVWLVDVNGDCVEVHRAPDSGVYTESLIRKRGQKVAPAALPDAELEVDAILG